MTTDNDWVEVYADDSGEWRWRRQAGNGEIVSTSEGFVDKHDAAESAVRNNPGIVLRVIEDEK